MLIKFIFIGFFLSPLLSFAQALSTVEKVYGSDFMSAQDSITVQAPSGVKTFDLISAHPGSPLKTEEKRSIVLLEPADLNSLPFSVLTAIERQIGDTDISNYWAAANFVHTNPNSSTDNLFYIALIPKPISILDVVFQIEWFGTGAGAHNQIRFRLDKNIILIEQTSGEYTETLQQPEVIYSLQAIRTLDGAQEWDPVKGIMGEFANALQFFSLEAKARKQVKQSVVENYRIVGLSAQQRQLIFMEAMKTSNEKQEFGIYNTVLNSCVTAALHALKAGLPNINPSHYNPYTVLEHLMQKQPELEFVLTGTMNDEFRSKISNVLSWNDIRKQEAYSKVQAFYPLITEPQFELFVLDFASFLAVEKIQAQDVEVLLAALSENGLNVPATLAKQPVARKVMNYLEQKAVALWGESQVNNYLQSLGLIRTDP